MGRKLDDIVTVRHTDQRVFCFEHITEYDTDAIGDIVEGFVNLEFGGLVTLGIINKFHYLKYKVIHDVFLFLKRKIPGR